MGTSREAAGVTLGAGAGPRAGTHIPSGAWSEVLVGSNVGRGPPVPGVTRFRPPGPWQWGGTGACKNEGERQLGGGWG